MKTIQGPFTLIDRPLWFHTAGRSETASGYGSRLTSRYVILLPGEKKPRRLYVIQYSNSGTHYVRIKGQPAYPYGPDLQTAYDTLQGR